MSTVPSRRVYAGAVAMALACRSALGSVPDPGTAEALFRQGRANVEAGDYTRACAAFAESQRIEPAPGTLLNLADCEEHVGRLASSRAHFLRVAQTLPPSDERHDVARDRAEALAARVPQIAIVAGPDLPRDARVFCDDVEVDVTRLAAPLPVDPGPHGVLVVAPGRASKTSTVIAVERETVRVVAAPGPLQRVLPDPSPSRDRTAAWLVGGGAVLSLGLGSYFGARALAERNTSDETCRGTVCASAAGLAAYASARGDARVADVALGVGAAGLVAAAILLATSHGEVGADKGVFVSAAGLAGRW